MKKSAAIFTAVCIISLLGYAGGVYALAVLVERYPAIGPFVFVDTHGSHEFAFWKSMIQPGGFLAVILFSLVLEAICLGASNSSIKRLLARESESTRVDLFYVALRLVGGINFLAFVFSFGLLFWVVNQVHRFMDIGVLQYVHSAVIQFGIVYLINTFVAYWGHRLMHTSWMWEIHKVHHAAEEMNVVTPFRNHPIDHLINSLLNAVPVALLGADRHVIIFYYAVNMVYQSLVHSEIRLPGGRLWDAIWITPAAHRIHHSNRVEHFDTNFGIMTLWDYVFGTYRLPHDEQLQYGIDDGAQFNRPQHVREVFANVRRWAGLGPKFPTDAAMPPALGETDSAEAIDIGTPPLRKSA